MLNLSWRMYGRLFITVLKINYSGVRTYLNLVPTSSHFQTWCRQIAFLPQKIVKNGYFIEKFKKYGADQSARRYMFSCPWVRVLYSSSIIVHTVFQWQSYTVKLGVSKLVDSKHPCDISKCFLLMQGLFFWLWLIKSLSNRYVIICNSTHWTKWQIQHCKYLQQNYSHYLCYISHCHFAVIITTKGYYLYTHWH